MPTRLSDRACIVLATALILFAAGLRIVFLLNSPLDLAADEAHYWDWSRRPDWSYYSKGPLIAWIIRASCELLGPLSVSLTGNLAFAVRAPAVLFGSLLLVAMYILTVQASRDHRLALAVAAVLLTQPSISAGSTLMTIDSPYTCAWAWALVLALHALRTDARWAWLSAGAVICLGVLAKYTMVLFLPSLALYLLAARERRGQLLHSGPWLMVAVAALSAVPILLWNAGNGWVTFRHVAQLAGFGPASEASAGLKWLGPVQYIGGQAALMLGAWFAFWVCAVVAYRPGQDSDEDRQYLWWMSVPIFVFFLSFSLKKGSGELNWPVTSYLSGGVLSAIWLASVMQHGTDWQKRLVTGGVIAGVVLGMLGVALMHGSGHLYPVLGPLAGTPGPKEPFPMRRIDPTCRLRGWRQLAAEVDRVRDGLKGEEVVLAGSGWTLPGMLGVYCAGHPEVYCLGSAQGERLSQYDLWRNPIDDRRGFLGKTFVVVGSPAGQIREAFTSVEERPPVRVVVSGQAVASHGVWVCRGFKGLDRSPVGRH